jgi:hypothetical protein
VYEDKLYSVPSYLRIINEAGIETQYFGDYFNYLLMYVRDKEGVKEGNAVMRLLHFLKKEKLFDLYRDKE